MSVQPCGGHSFSDGSLAFGRPARFSIVCSLFGGLTRFSIICSLISKLPIRAGLIPLVLRKLYGSSGLGATHFNKSLCFEWVHTHSFCVNYTFRMGQLTRSNQNLLFEWGLIPIKTEKVFIFLHNFTIIVFLQRECTHSFGSKCLIRVGYGPLILIKVCVSSGSRPTRFA